MAAPPSQPAQVDQLPPPQCPVSHQGSASSTANANIQPVQGLRLLPLATSTAVPHCFCNCLLPILPPFTAHSQFSKHFHRARPGDMTSRQAHREDEARCLDYRTMGRPTAF